MLFGSAFTLARTRSRKRQGVIARAIGMDASYLAGIEHGRRKAPNPETMRRLLSELGAPPSHTNQLRMFGLTDRLLDVVDEYGEDDEIAVRVGKLLRQIAEFGDREWNSLDWAVSALTHQLNQRKEEIGMT
jgi:transcriptional regulator with XRE-family HTH domain